MCAYRLPEQTSIAPEANRPTDDTTCGHVVGQLDTLVFRDVPANEPGDQRTHSLYVKLHFDLFGYRQSHLPSNPINVPIRHLSSAKAVWAFQPHAPPVHERDCSVRVTRFAWAFGHGAPLSDEERSDWLAARKVPLRQTLGPAAFAPNPSTPHCRSYDKPSWFPPGLSAIANARICIFFVIVPR